MEQKRRPQWPNTWGKHSARPLALTLRVLCVKLHLIRSLKGDGHWQNSLKFLGYYNMLVVTQLSWMTSSSENWLFWLWTWILVAIEIITISINNHSPVFPFFSIFHSFFEISHKMKAFKILKLFPLLSKS